MKIIRIIRWFRGLGHAHGFGVQSPFAYHFIREICSFKVRGSKEEIIAYIIGKVNALTADFNGVQGNIIVCMEDVYSNKEKYRQWMILTSNSNFDMTFDFFYVCVAIKRIGLGKKNYIVNY